MKSLSSLSRSTLFKSFIALAIYPLLSSVLSDKSVQDRDDDDYRRNSMDLDPPSLALKESPFADQYSMRIFSLNYFAFLLVMLAIDGLLKVLSQLFRKTKDIVGYQDSEAPIQANWKQGMIQTVIISTIVCCFYQLRIEAQSGYLQEIQSYRSLEEIDSINYEYEQHQEERPAERISLSMGKVLSSLNLHASHVIATKDMKYAFVTLLSSGAVKVVDISNIVAPNVVKTLSPANDLFLYRQRFMYLSPDEKTLFVSSFENLEIIDVTNPDSAYSLADVTGNELQKISGTYDKFRLSISFALSADSKTLFIGGFGLQTFDISDIKNPILLNSQINKVYAGFSGNPLLAVGTTADKKTLWVANGTLDSYDISDARNRRLINSFSDAKISMNSMILSHDRKTAFALGMIGSEKIQITILNISSPASPVKIESFILAQPSFKPAFIMSLSQKDRYLFITASIEHKGDIIVVLDLIEKRIMNNDQSLLMTTMAAVTTLSRENYILASGSGKMMIIEFYKDFPNREIFSLTDYPMWKMNMINNYSYIEFSQGEKHLFVSSSEEPTSSKSLFEIHDFQNRTSPDLLISFEIDFVPLSILISTDGKRACILNNQRIKFYDTSNPTAPSYHTEYSFESYSDIEDVAFWSDSNIVFVVIYRFQREKLRVMDLSDPKSPSMLHELTLPSGEYESNKMAFSQNKTIFFLAGSVLRIYNSSDVHKLDKIGSINITTEETEHVNFVQVSQDGSKCFVETLDRSSFHKLKIYDTSDLTLSRLGKE